MLVQVFGGLVTGELAVLFSAMSTVFAPSEPVEAMHSANRRLRAARKSRCETARSVSHGKPQAVFEARHAAEDQAKPAPLAKKESGGSKVGHRVY